MRETTGQLVPGARLNDYVIEDELSAKPGEIAYAATHALLPRRARVQSLHPTFAGVQAIAVQLMREACILEALHHPGVPRVYETGLLADRRPWIAVELIEGPTLAEELATRGPLAVPDVVFLLRDAASILHHAHARGLVHRNIRPEVIARRLEGPCIIDWADARTNEASAHQPVPSGALEYQPPEVACGEPMDSRGDVFALGVVAYEALSLSRPTLSAARRLPGAPRRLTALIDRMLAVDAVARPTCAEVRAEAVSLVELVDIPVPSEEDESVVEEVEIHIDGDTEVTDDLPMLSPASNAFSASQPREARVRWTPAEGYLPRVVEAPLLPSQLLGPGRGKEP
jgi:eukaryotic-like serine/threonine-protein kinase